jgi:hypothetical protein
MILGSAGVAAGASAVVLVRQQTIQPPPIAEHLHDVHHRPPPLGEPLLIGGVLVCIGAQRAREGFRYIKTLADGDDSERRVMKLPWHHT